MCGIAGIVWKGTGPCPFDAFRASGGQIAHRGPDSYGEFRDERGALLHHRLAIIDLSEAGHQPYERLRDGDVGVYNGELYNYRELAARYGLRTTSTSDTETFFRLLQEEGERVVSEYNGIFAFALYRPSSERLLLGRDRFGVKPLYYVDTPAFFAFASEAKVLYEVLPELKLNAQVLGEFLTFGSSIGTSTIVRRVEKVPPGTSLSVDLTTFEVGHRSFYSVERDVIAAGPINRDYATAKREVRRLLSAAVTRQCMSDVPVGAYLSGGIDSSIVVALASQVTTERLSTFSASFEGSENSELPLARQVARRYQTDHHEMEVTTRHLEDEIEALILQYDEPFADPAAIPLHLMAKQCGKLAKVVLQGDGGDELFAGYGRHLDLSQRRRRMLGFGTLAALHPSAQRRALMRNRFEHLRAGPLYRRLAEMVGVKAISSYPLAPTAWSTMGSTEPLRVYREVATPLRGLSPVQQMLYTDMQVILHGKYLEKVDKVSMWHSIEARVPLLDNELADYVMRLPADIKISNGRTKALLRDVGADLLPEDVFVGRKQSFGTPMDVWLRKLLVKFVQRAFARGERRWRWLFDFSLLRHLHDEHVRGAGRHASVLWRSVVLLTWLEHHRDKLDLGAMGARAAGASGIR